MKSKKNVTYVKKSFVWMKIMKMRMINENDKNEDDENENDENEKDEKDEKFKQYRKVKDHCHYTGKFREAAHSDWNLRYKIPKSIPIVIHNAGYVLTL